MNWSVEPLYQIDVRCPNCELTYRTSRVRSRYKHAQRVDSDFCPHYSSEAYNPDYYVVYICTHCGCATSENGKKQWTDKQKQQFKERIGAQWTPQDYSGERDWESALKTYQLGLLTAQMIQESDRVLAGLLHHIAWLYRYRNDTEQEQRYLKFALQAYIAVYEKESEELNDAKLIYMMGELHRRLGQYQDAAKFFARLIHDKRIMDAAMIRAAREQWAVMREEMKAQQLETPDEMFEEKRTIISSKK